MHRSRSVTQILVWLIAAALSTACGGEPSGTREEPLAAVCARVDDALARMPAFPSIDDVFEAAARIVPGGFAGVIGGATGTPIVLVQPARLAEAKMTAARAFTSCQGADRVYALDDISRAVAAQPGRYDWITLRVWYNALLRGLGASVQWQTTDIDERSNQLRITVLDAASAERVRSVAIGLAIPGDALTVSIEQHGIAPGVP